MPKMIVKVEKKGAVVLPQLLCNEYVPGDNNTAGELLPPTTAIDLVSIDGKTLAGVFDTKTNNVYKLTCEFIGPPGSSIEVTVYYPPSPPGKWPDEVGDQAAQRKHEKNTVLPGKGAKRFLLRVPGKGAIK